MKNSFILCLVILMLSFIGVSQESIKDSTHSKNFNEIKLNALLLVIGAFDITYERTLSKRSGIGITTFITYDSDKISDLNYYISPYYRFYIGKKYASGFFFEGFGMLNSQNLDMYTGETMSVSFFGIPFSFRETEPLKTTDFALGLGLGSKWVIKSKFIVELSFGVGANLFEDYNNTTRDTAAIVKGGISVGYRF